ncbi:hypothetical protein HZA42_01350 [Candidatus Peregrinibacteria bacterium]|nr:hypothetical protein [Candidatus Peregrinibacteria bacterium]
MSIKKKIIVVCHDAGGAEIIAAFLKYECVGLNSSCFVAGPAVAIFARYGIPVVDMTNVKEPLKIIFDWGEDPFFILFGIGWSSLFEISALQEALRRGITTVVYLDHWLNYRERFGYPQDGWKKRLPNEIWVGDSYAESIAKKEFPEILIRFVPNRSFDDAKARYASIADTIKEDPEAVLFLGEPMNEPINAMGMKRKMMFTEFDVLDDMLYVLSKKDEAPPLIIIRLHPSESKDKYNLVIAKYSSLFKIRISEATDLCIDLAAVGVVIGMESMALVVAYLCGKRTISYLPDESKQCGLPFTKIEKIKILDDLKKVLLHAS